MEDAAVQNRTDRKKEKTKREIIQAAMELFRNSGVEATTMEQIAQAADIAKGTLYNYFPVKEAIISEYMKQAFEDRKEERIALIHHLNDTRSRMRRLFLELLRGIEQYTEIFEKYILYHMKQMVSFHQDQTEKSGFNLLVKEIIELGRRENELRTDLPFFVLEDLLGFAFVELVKQYYMNQDKSNITDILERCIDLFISGASKAPNKK
jgi:AcrR family transcriptional regulator